MLYALLSLALAAAAVAGPARGAAGALEGSAGAMGRIGGAVEGSAAAVQGWRAHAPLRSAMPPGRPRPDPRPLPDPGLLVRRVQAGVESGRAEAERRAWSGRRAAAPFDREALLALATLDRLTYRDADAEREYAWVLADPRADPDAYAGFARLGLGLLRAQQARLSEADPLLRRAAGELAGAGHAAGAAEALAVLGTVASRTASLDSARALLARARGAAPPADAWLASFIDCSTLLVRVRQADPAAARLARPEAEAALRANNPRAASACLAALAQDYERRTMVDSALATFAQVAALQRGTRNFSALAATRQWEGYVLDMRGDFPASRAALEEALVLGRRTGALAAASWASLGLADLALTFGDLHSSGRYARTAAVLFARTGDHWGVLQTRMHEGEVALLNRALPAARAAFEQVAREAAAVSPSLAVHAHGHLAAVALLEGDPTEAQRELDSARVLAVRLDMPEWREEDGYGRALLALQRGQPAEAERRLRTLQRVIPATELAEQSELLTRLAEVHARANRMDEAVMELGAAGALLDRWRAALPQRELRAAVVQARRLDWDRDLGFATVIDRIAQTGRLRVAFALAEQRRARLLLEHIIQRHALAGDRASGRLAPTGLPDAAIRRVLPDSVALLSFVTGRGGEPTTVFVLTRDRLAAAAADPVDDHILELDRFSGLVAAGTIPAQLAQSLGKAFLRTALALLPSSTRRLVLVPDGPLHHLPFDVLGDGDGHLLLDRFEISLAPSASVAAAWWSDPPRAPRPGLLAFGDPAGAAPAGDAGAPRLPRLPAAASEARRIARFASDARVYTGADARESRLVRASLGDVGVLHFATHAQVDESSLLDDELLLAPGDGEDGPVGADELAGLRIGANLVVLSACRSGSGAVLAGEGLVGLTEPLLEAGAAAVVASLWEVGDRSVAPFMELFYREMASGEAVGTALQRAKRAARAQGMPPGVWAGFTLTGDARVRTALRPPGTFRAGLPAAATLVACAAFYLAWRTRSRRKAERR